MLTRRWFGTVLLGGAAVAAMLPADDDPIKSALQQRPASTHPRLHLREAEWRALAEAVRRDPLLASWHAALQRHAETLIRRPPASYTLTGPRLLNESRKALETIGTLGALHRLDGDPRKAERVRRELAAICAFPDWHPAHFLDTAEMTNAAALGYDWMHDVLDRDERALLRARIVEFGLKPGLREYESGAWWSRRGTNNWGQVCNGGVAMGALALLGEAPEAAEILSRAVPSVRHAMAAYAPDGGWAEGPGYWHYATFYATMMISALQSALGTDFGLADLPGFAATGGYRVQSIGPTGRTFNHGDAVPDATPAPEVLWLARRFGRPGWAAGERDVVAGTRPGIFHLLWGAATPAGQGDPPPLDVRFTEIDTAFFRSAWNDPRAIFVGFKGGTNGISHSHLDLGSFVLDAKGRRWALDLGPDDYDLPGYFDGRGPRWRYYRLRTESHNTLGIGGENQVAGARAPMSGFGSTARVGSAGVNLAAAYAPHLAAALRTVTLDRGRRTVLVRDELRGARGTPLRWRLHTPAAVTVEGRTARLEQQGETITLRILAPEDAAFTAAHTPVPKPQAQNEGVTTLTLALSLPDAVVEIAVLFELA